MTHEDLRKAAVIWLTNTQRCSAVLSEMTSYTSQIPDAIGFRHNGSIAVECKVTRSDWRANRDKPSVRSGRHVGNYRYYLVPRRLLSEDDISEEPGYGLLWAPEERGTSLRVVKPAPLHADGEICWADERTMLVSALRRVRTRQFLTLNLCTCCEEQPGVQELTA